MATVLQTIQKGFRRCGAIGHGVTVTARQKDIGLERLQDMFMAMSDTAFGALHDKYLTSASAYTAREFERVINTAGATITLPSTVDDFSAECTSYDYGFSGGSGSSARPPLDGAVVVTVVPGANPQVNIYDSNMAAWQRVDNLTIGAECPLTNRWADGIANILATYIADDIGISITPMLARNAGAARLMITSRYGSARKPAHTDYF